MGVHRSHDPIDHWIHTAREKGKKQENARRLDAIIFHFAIPI
jgi:hypothetical protein